VTVTDDAACGRTTSRRGASISLLPSLTEIVCALGACERLVGVDDYSNWPAACDAAARGRLDDAHIEAHRRAQARPGAGARSPRARWRGCRRWADVFVAEPRTLADVRRVLRAARARCWRARGEGLARVEQGVDAAARELPPRCAARACISR
jgi:iron complex transport system substrate-binding protein